MPWILIALVVAFFWSQRADAGQKKKKSDGSGGSGSSSDGSGSTGSGSGSGSSPGAPDVSVIPAAQPGSSGAANPGLYTEIRNRLIAAVKVCDYDAALSAAVTLRTLAGLGSDYPGARNLAVAVGRTACGWTSSGVPDKSEGWSDRDAAIAGLVLDSTVGGITNLAGSVAGAIV